MAEQRHRKHQRTYRSNNIPFGGLGERVSELKEHTISVLQEFGMTRDNSEKLADDVLELEKDLDKFCSKKQAKQRLIAIKNGGYKETKSIEVGRNKWEVKG